MAEPHTTFDLVLLDRDGVINADSQDYIKSAEEWHALPGAGAAVATMVNAGQQVAICTNQSGLARGLFDDATLATIHAKLNAHLTKQGTRIDHIYWCPHGPNDNCPCRKPAPGLLLRAMTDLQCTPEHTAFVGDSLRDLQAATAAGCRPVLVLTGNGLKTQAQLALPKYKALASQTWVADDLMAATQLLVTGR